MPCFPGAYGSFNDRGTNFFKGSVISQAHPEIPGLPGDISFRKFAMARSNPVPGPHITQAQE
jgi:hypothetical protein